MRHKVLGCLSPPPLLVGGQDVDVRHVGAVILIESAELIKAQKIFKCGCHTMRCDEPIGQICRRRDLQSEMLFKKNFSPLLHNMLITKRYNTIKCTGFYKK